MPAGTGLCDTAMSCSEQGWGSWDTLEKQVAQVLAQEDYEQRSAHSQRAAAAVLWWEQHTALPSAPGQSCKALRDPPATPPLGSYPRSCWSSPKATGSSGFPPSWSSRLCSFFATKLNLRRE